MEGIEAKPTLLRVFNHLTKYSISEPLWISEQFSEPRIIRFLHSSHSIEPNRFLKSLYELYILMSNSDVHLRSGQLFPNEVMKEILDVLLSEPSFFLYLWFHGRIVRLLLFLWHFTFRFCILFRFGSLRFCVFFLFLFCLFFFGFSGGTTGVGFFGFC